MAILEVAQLEKSFGGTKVLRDISFSLEEGQALSIIGSSGSGKTTLLRCLNFLETPDSGRIAVRGRNLLDGSLSPQERRRNRLHFGLVFQDFNLFPQYTALENVTLARRLLAKSERTGEAPEAIRREGEALLEQMGLGDRMGHYPHQLSGGQKQRVAIARALVNRPKVLLLDEPLAALDLKLRKDMQIELKRIQQQVGITFIYVTHDQEEALTMSDTIVVMDKGSIQQIGTPEDIYNEPKNAFVADFIGESNIIDGIMLQDDLVQMYGKTFPCLDGGFAPNEPVDVVIRPEDIDIVPVEQGQLTGTVTSVTFKGMQYDIIVDFKGFKWLIQTTDHSPVGSRIGIKIDPDGIHVMKKSAYSGMFGDYSSFSEEYDELDDASLALDEEESGDEN